MFGESGASGNICIWSAALTQWHKQKQSSSNVNVDVRPNGGCFLPRRSAQHGISPFVQRTTACANAFRQRLHSPSRSHAHITHRTLQKAELFCEIRMMRQAAVAIARSAMDAYDCWLFPKSLTQPEGE